MSEPLSEVEIYTDGGADPNPGPGGWGAVLLHPASGKHRELTGGEPRTTNNRMELTAAIEALASLDRPCRVHLVTDSQYLKRGITEWLPAWIARGWRRKTGEIQNLDLWQRLAEEVKRHQIDWRWVRGHAGHRWNERADELARQAGRKAAPRREAAARSADGAAHPTAPPPAVEIFLKVSCPSERGGWAALVRRAGGKEDEADKAEVVTGAASGVSANRLEVLAAAELLERLPKGAAVALHAGSDYLRNGATQWLDAWRRRGWKTKEGAAVKNRDAWQRLETAMRGRRVSWPKLGPEPPEEVEADLKRLEKLARAAAAGERPEGGEPG